MQLSAIGLHQKRLSMAKRVLLMDGNKRYVRRDGADVCYNRVGKRRHERDRFRIQDGEVVGC